MTAPWSRIILFAATFFVVTSLTIGMTRYGGGLALVWFGSAIAAVMLIGLAREYWLRGLVAIVAASALATSLFGFGPHMAAPLALINTLEAWLIARLLLALRPQRDWLDNVGGLAVLVTVGGIVAPGLVAIIGGFAATYAAPGGWQLHAANWWAGHGLGTIIGFPIVYLALGAPFARQRPRTRRAWTRKGSAELVGHLVLIGLVTGASLSHTVLPLFFLPIVPLLLAAFRCGRLGATLGVLIIAAICAWQQADGSLLGSIAVGPEQRVLFLQFYVATLSLLAIPTSVALRQHQLVLIELEDRRALKQLIAEHSDDALLNLDQHGRIRYASPASIRLSGIDELVGEPLATFFDPLDEQLVRGVLAQAAADPGETCDMERAVIRGEDQLWLEAKVRAVALEGKQGGLHGYAVTIRDVTARKQTELDAIHASETDPLTGLANRRALMRQLERGLAHAEQRPFALAILDLDHFKVVNDTHGHNAGDQVLREVAAVMRRMSSPSRYFARLGGEEFAIVSRQPSHEGSIALCEQLREAIAELRFTAPDGARFKVTASIGCARIAKGGPAAQALQFADALLYHAKHGGRDRVEALTATGDRRTIRRAA